MKDHEIATVVNDLREAATTHRVAQSLRERMAKIIVPHLKRLAELEAQLERKPFTPDWDRLQACRDSVKEHQQMVRDLQAQLKMAQAEANSLAMSMWRDFYQAESPEFELCDSTRGVITQLDNMYCGIREKLKTANELIKESSDYLDINEHTSIGNGSILHRKLKAQSLEGKE